MALPERRKTPEEIERLREANLPAHVLPRLRASMGNEEIVEQAGEEEVLPEVRGRARAIAGEFRHLSDPSEPAPAAFDWKRDEVKISHEEVSHEGEDQADAVSGEISHEGKAAKAQAEISREEILVEEEAKEEEISREEVVMLTKRVDEAATFRKEEEALAEDAFVVEKSDLPVQKRSEEELEHLRFLQSLEIRDVTENGEMKVKMAGRFKTLRAGWLLLTFCYVCLLLGPVGLLMGLWLGWKKPLSRHHAAILVIGATLVTLFGGLRAYDQVPQFRAVVDRAQSRVQKLFHF